MKSQSVSYPHRARWSRLLACSLRWLRSHASPSSELLTHVRGETPETPVSKGELLSHFLGQQEAVTVVGSAPHRAGASLCVKSRYLAGAGLIQVIFTGIFGFASLGDGIVFGSLGACSAFSILASSCRVMAFAAAPFHTIRIGPKVQFSQRNAPPPYVKVTFSNVQFSQLSPSRAWRPSENFAFRMTFVEMGGTVGSTPSSTMSPPEGAGEADCATADLWLPNITTKNIIITDPNATVVLDIRPSPHGKSDCVIVHHHYGELPPEKPEWQIPQDKFPSF